MRRKWGVVFTLAVLGGAALHFLYNVWPNPLTAVLAPVNESVWEQIENLDLEELQAYLDGLDGFSDQSVAERLYDYVTGEAVDYKSFASAMADVLLKNVKNLLPAFLCVTAVTLLCGVVTTLKSGLPPQRARK